jgi:hypothetical protein
MPAPAGLGPRLPPLCLQPPDQPCVRAPLRFGGDCRGAAFRDEEPRFPPARETERALLCVKFGALLARCRCGPCGGDGEEKGIRADVPDHRSGSHRLRLRSVRAPPIDDRRATQRTAAPALHGEPVPDRREAQFGAAEEAGAHTPAGRAARGIANAGLPVTDLRDARELPVTDLRDALVSTFQYSPGDGSAGRPRLDVPVQSWGRICGTPSPRRSSTVLGTDLRDALVSTFQFSPGDTILMVSP